MISWPPSSSENWNLKKQKRRRTTTKSTKKRGYNGYNKNNSGCIRIFK
jgi:hypothetical protein